MVAALSQTQVALGLHLLSAETKGTCRCGDVMRISGHLITSGQLSHILQDFYHKRNKEKSVSRSSNEFSNPTSISCLKTIFLSESKQLHKSQSLNN